MLEWRQALEVSALARSLATQAKNLAKAAEDDDLATVRRLSAVVDERASAIAAIAGALRKDLEAQFGWS